MNINEWHNAVQFAIDDIAEELQVIPSRHIRASLTGGGIAYPRFDEINKTQFIDKLETPRGFMTYDEVFNLALNNVIEVWELLSGGIFGGNDSFQNKIKIWDLDNGQEVKTAKVLWEGGI